MEEVATPRKWIEIVRAVLEANGQAERRWHGGYLSFSGTSFSLEDRRQEICVYQHTPDDKPALFDRCIIALGKHDIHAEIVAKTPQRGAHVRVPKLYDDWKN